MLTTPMPTKPATSSIAAPLSRRQTGNDEHLARLLRPLIGASGSPTSAVDQHDQRTDGD
jgi:hypothetical protein